MSLVAKTDQTTGNQTFCSYVLQSNELLFSFTAPYSQQTDHSGSTPPQLGFDPDVANAFFDQHGLAVRAVGVLVEDAEKAFRIAVANGAVGVLEPALLTDKSTGGKAKLAEVILCGDVVLRLVSNHGFNGPYLPNFEAVESLPITYGIERLHHAVGNVPDLVQVAGYVKKLTGFHEIRGYASADIHNFEGGMKRLSLASDNEAVILQLNRPVLNEKGEGQIHSFMEHNEGSGVQRLAMVCADIFATVEEMRMRSQIGGFEFVPAPPLSYYKNLPERVGRVLTDTQCKKCEELGLLVCVDEHGVFLQAFTKPLGDRPTIFIEVMQRVGRRKHTLCPEPRA